MKCAWSAYLNLLPHWMRTEVDKIGKDTLLELRLHLSCQPELITKYGSCYVLGKVTDQDIDFVMNAASEYSPWTATSVSDGYITASGGHRVGVCGVTAVHHGDFIGIQKATSLCIRVARDYYGIADGCVSLQESILILGPPGCGKTTLLRDLIRSKSNKMHSYISVVDEREEIFPFYKGQACFSCGMHTDVLSRCPKHIGINAVLRSMAPEWIAVDEITTEKDCESIIHAGWCGVKLLATAHAANILDLTSRPIYRPLVETKLFTNIILLDRDKSWKLERVVL